MKSAARRQREHVERLSQPISRRKTVYVQPYNNCGDSGEYLTIGIPQDMTQLHQVLDKIHGAVGYKLITPVVGLYRYRDQTRVHSVREIQNNERLIYVCQGELQSINTSYYTSSQSSENSQQQWQQQQRGPLPIRQNSGSSSSGQQRGQGKGVQRSNVTWQRQKSLELDLGNSLIVPQIISDKEVRFQTTDQDNVLYQSKSARLPTTQQQRSSLKQKLRPSQTMPRQVEHEEQLEFNTTQSVVSGQVSIASGIPPKRAISFSHTKSMIDYSDFLGEESADLGAPRRVASEPRKRRGKSSTEITAMSSDNFSFDVRLNEEEEELSSTPTYGSSGQSLSQRVKADSMNSSSQKVRGEFTKNRSLNDANFRLSGDVVMQEDFDAMTSAYRSNEAKFIEGSDFDALNSTLQIDEQDEEEELTQMQHDFLDELDFSERSSYDIYGDGSKVRLSPILEPVESPRLMPVIPESEMHSARAPDRSSHDQYFAVKHSSSGRAQRFL